MDRLLLVDGSNLLFQMYYGMPSSILNRDGKAIHGTLGFVGALLKILRMVQPTHTAVLFDGECSNPRTSLDKSYKANRADDPRVVEDSPFTQLEDIFLALSHLNIMYGETVDCETDDWVAGYAKRFRKEAEIVIASMDSDFFQLISSNVRVLRYRGKGSILCDEAYIREKYGIEPRQYADFKSLTGDASDNIPGIRGVGPKTAARLLHEFDTLDGIVANLDKLKGNAVRRSLGEQTDRLFLNRQLITLEGACKLPFALEELRWEDTGISAIKTLREIGLY